MQILESYVDSSSIFYFCETLGQIEFHEGKICKFNPFSSAFVSLKAAGVTYMVDKKVLHYPLYSMKGKEIKN